MSKEVTVEEKSNKKIDFDTFKNEIIADYTLACTSRETSLLGRREVLTGKAKFGIFGDGKEIAQIALSKQFRDGDFRSGYYRGQTLMMAMNQLTVQEYFAGLYAETNLELEPMSGGRQMGGHFATHSLDVNGEWKDLMKQKNSSSDISPTSGQMSRLLGLALASKIYRNHKGLDAEAIKKFSNNGNEIAFGMIGDASTSEGPFWETLNAAGVLQVPMVMSVWDDGYGISVPRKHQTIKGSISEALSGFQRTADKKGFEILTTKGWDYPHLCTTYEKAAKIAREEHIPVLVHVTEVTQPQGHSTSGSHERYKSKERLQWEKDFDPITKFKEFILNYTGNNGEIIATEDELEAIEKEAKSTVRSDQKEAWKNFRATINTDKNKAIQLMKEVAEKSANQPFISKEIERLEKAMDPIRMDVFNTVNKVIRYVRGEKNEARVALITWYKEQLNINEERYGSHLYSQSKKAVRNIIPIPPEFNDDKEEHGRVILRDNFEALFKKYPEIITFGEDTGKIGGVNQTMEGMQEMFGELRVSDTGIRENTIIGQGIGMAMRGLRPLAEIQYLDYILFAIQVISDDLATLHYRTKGRQKAPLIFRTRGHRLEGIWHSGSPMGMIINSARGINICVPRNMTIAAGMYNTLFEADEPAFVIEPLNGYRKKERVPSNIGEYRISLGKIDVVKEGTDVTVVSYGSTFNITEEAVKELEKVGISVELIDVQTLLPFDIEHEITRSLEKTNRLVVVDEDVSSGATAYMLDQIIVKQKGYYHLDSEPVTVSAKDHRPAYASDGDYFSKPSGDEIYTAIYQLMSEVNPKDYPSLFEL